MEFDRNESIGARHASEIADYLEAIGDDEAANRFRLMGGRSQAISVPYLTNDQWANSGASIGFIPAGPHRDDMVEICNATAMEPDHSLAHTSLKISLDRFYVHNYPGIGKHEILCEFTGKNQASEKTEEMRFALKTEAQDQSAAPLIGLPVFVGVNVGRDGLSLEGRTVSIRSEGSEALLDALDNSAFKAGLSLLSTAQPALVPFVQLAKGAVRTIANQGSNRVVFTFGLGLDFAQTATSAKLRLGSYVVVQTNEVDWDWSSFGYIRTSGAIVPKTDRSKPIRLNYMIIGVTRASRRAVEPSSEHQDVHS